ncbi:MAG: hypothetical protein KA146_02160 [Leptospiraceae bacterium]|nr:hypothetical protein [Leptospiraceae bacterium]
MQVTQITAMRRRPLEQYGHVEISMVATLEDGANVMNSAIQLRRYVEQATLERIPMEETQQMSFPTKEAEEKSKPVEAKAETKVEAKAEVKEEKKVEAKEEKKAKAKAEPKVEAKAEPKAKKVEGTPYDRSNDLHKKLMAEFLDAQFTPNWKTTVLQKAKDASVALEGTAFLDAEGLMLQSFKDAFVQKMK